MTVVCASCRAEFEAKRSTAKFCTATCRSRARRGTRNAGGDGLVESLTRELIDAGRLDTFAGQLAIQLAREVTAAGATGIAGLSKELRQVRAEALDGIEPGEVEPDSDEVDEMRERRERKARQAADRA